MNDSVSPLFGLANLMRVAFAGGNLLPLAHELLTRAQNDAKDGNALVDLSTVLQLYGLKEEGLATLQLALQTQKTYQLAAQHGPGIRLLALMAPGDLMLNAPLPFLFEDSDISLTMLYLLPGAPLPQQWPEHDVLFMAISDSGQTHGLLEQLVPVLRQWPKPVLIRPECAMRTARSRVFSLLHNRPGICVAPTAQATRAGLQALCAGSQSVSELLPDGHFPLIIRPLESHAGHGLEKVADLAELTSYLAQTPEDIFVIANFIDYRSADGLYRKYRVVLVDGVAFAGHMGVSQHWMIHYLNAGMAESAEKRAEEAAFMRDFDCDFALRHARALRCIHERFDMAYLVLDCAITADGQLLVFEVDPGAVVHAMDPPELFPYKVAAMQKIFGAFRALLQNAVASQQTALPDGAPGGD